VKSREIREKHRRQGKAEKAGKSREIIQIREKQKKSGKSGETRQQQGNQGKAGISEKTRKLGRSWDVASLGWGKSYDGGRVTCFV